MTRPVRDARVRPLVAVHALRRLVADPQDTPQVFTIIDALKGRTPERGLRRFAATASGRAILRDRRSLMARLEERTSLAALPPGTLGRAYHEFMAAEGLSAAGLAALSGKAGSAAESDVGFYENRVRDMHDLFHVLAGYGREPLGEVCVLAFTRAQLGGRGIAAIALVGMERMARDMPGCGARAAVLEGWRRGRAAAYVGAEPWEALLDQPLDALRRRCGLFRPPARYLAALLADRKRRAAGEPVPCRAIAPGKTRGSQGPSIGFADRPSGGCGLRPHGAALDPLGPEAPNPDTSG